ncbi:MAG: molybdenum cofactor guanylyltransferase MobA [Candidatus Eutrophobiaceae bacterium]
MDSKAQITAVVLAGGKGRRLSGADKGLVKLAGRPLIDYILDALKPQCAAYLINANRNLATYAEWGYPVVPDAMQGFEGPLAGMATAMQKATTPLLLCVPCDSPFLCPDLAVRLHECLESAGKHIAVAHDGKRLQPVFCLLRRCLLPQLQAWLAAGNRKLDTWYAEVSYAQANFSDQPDMFINLNRPEDVSLAQARLGKP